MSEIPIPIGWKVIVKPKEGKLTSDGGIDVSASREAQEHLCYIGELVAVGEAAFTTKTKGGIDMSEWKVRPQVGDFVLYPPYAGQRISRSGEDEAPLRLLNDTDITALIGDPDAFYAWVDV
jgi:co-chaperonin GroES (HSP10)